MSNLETKAMSYETLICRAFKRRGYHSLKRNESSHTYSNFVDASNGKVMLKKLGNYDKQLTVVKNQVTKAIEAFLKRKLTIDEASGLLLLKHRLSNIYYEPDVYSIIQQALDITQPYKEY